MRLLALSLAGLALTACGGHAARSPAQVAQAWSTAVDRNDNDAAGALFSPGAQVVQNGTIVLRAHDDAVAWNQALPCGGRIVSMSVQGRNDVLVVFRLTERPHHVCDGSGQTAAAVFRVRGGKIVLWHQVPPPQAGQTV